ncbi:helix-turn-helix domain-containing protein [Nocardia salmonicida]|uniref:helix-turn-helix domain-containing protein n=1 Tax=Nocardia salmonicida TaxID=53431 RepID=UPI0007A514E1|nr:helix-turn-helix domain-containing protein [Nocardia salmonicida]
MELAGKYSKKWQDIHGLTRLNDRLTTAQPRTEQTPPPSTPRPTKKLLTAEEVADIAAKYEAGASMVQLRTAHRMAKRTVARVLQEAGVVVRPKGGRSAVGRRFD